MEDIGDETNEGRAINFGDEPNGGQVINQKYHFSRHLLSCNNIIDEHYGKAIHNARHKIGEPPLSLWGLLTGLMTAKNVVDEKENKIELEGTTNRINKVYVSCLLRTWLTAVIKYLAYSDISKPFFLVVSPYIKEKHAHSSLDSSNLPPRYVQTQLDKFYDFFELFKQIKFPDDPQYQEIIVKQQKIIERLKTVHLDFRLFNIRPIPLYPPKNVGNLTYYGKDTTSQNEIVEEKSKYLTDTIGRIHPSSDYNTPVPSFGVQEDFVGENHNDKTNTLGPHYMNSEFVGGKTKKKKQRGGVIIDPAFTNKGIPFRDMEVIFKLEVAEPNYITYYGQHGLILFTNWVQRHLKDNDPIIYVVAHSDIMQQFLLRLCNIIDSPNSYGVPTIPRCLSKFLRYDMTEFFHTNMWDLIFNLKRNMNTMLVLNKFILKQGEPPPPDGSMINIKGESTCQAPKQTFLGGKKRKSSNRKSRKRSYRKSSKIKK
jgi:hypothetical protein